jgi:hypothetical protein
MARKRGYVALADISSVAVIIAVKNERDKIDLHKRE